MKILIIGSKTSVLIRFRLDLIKTIINKGHEVIVIAPEEDSSAVLKKLGVKFLHIPLNKTSLFIFSNLKYFFNLIKILKIEKPDIVFSYTIKPIIFGSIASKLARVPHIYTMVTGLGYIYSGNNFKQKILQYISGIGYKIAFNYSEKVIFQNIDDQLEFTKQRKYVDISKCEIVNGSGVNMVEFPKSPLPTNVSFLMISRMLSLKGITEYFEAAKLVKEQYSNVKFVFTGLSDNSPLSINVQEKYHNYIHSGIIDFYENYDDINIFLKNSSVFVLPSYYREGIPRALLEALAVGRPIITTNSVGCKEVINYNKNGFLVNIKDSQDLANKMIYFIEHPEIIPVMAEESYNYCKLKFDVNLINNQILKILNL